MRSVEEACGIPLSTASGFWGRAFGIHRSHTTMLWLPNCRWVHSFGLARPLLVLNPVRATDTVYVQYLWPNRLGRPVPSSAGTLEIEISGAMEQRYASLSSTISRCCVFKKSLFWSDSEGWTERIENPDVGAKTSNNTTYGEG